jgi:hypothetical protein
MTESGVCVFPASSAGHSLAFGATASFPRDLGKWHRNCLSFPFQIVVTVASSLRFGCLPVSCASFARGCGFTQTASLRVAHDSFERGWFHDRAARTARTESADCCADSCHVEPPIVGRAAGQAQTQVRSKLLLRHCPSLARHARKQNFILDSGQGQENGDRDGPNYQTITVLLGFQTTSAVCETFFELDPDVKRKLILKTG